MDAYQNLISGDKMQLIPLLPEITKLNLFYAALRAESIRRYLYYNTGSLYLQNVSKLTNPNFSIAVATFLLNSSSSILALGNEYLKSIKFMLGKLYEQ